MNGLYRLNKEYIDSGYNPKVLEFSEYFRELRFLEQESFKVLCVNFEIFSDKGEMFRIYKKKVWEVTESQDLKSLKDFDKRSFKGHHLDHKASIKYCFDNGVPFAVAGSLFNLRMIPYKENLTKNTDCYWDDSNRFIRDL